MKWPCHFLNHYSLICHCSIAPMAPVTIISFSPDPEVLIGINSAFHFLASLPILHAHPENLPNLCVLGAFLSSYPHNEYKSHSYTMSTTLHISTMSTVLHIITMSTTLHFSNMSTTLHINTMSTTLHMQSGKPHLRENFPTAKMLLLTFPYGMLVPEGESFSLSALQFPCP